MAVDDNIHSKRYKVPLLGDVLIPEGDPKEFKPQSDNIHSELYFVDSSEMLLSSLLLGDVIIPEGALRV